MLADIQKFLAEQDFSSSDWQIFYAGLLVASLLWLGKSIWQRLTHKPPIFEGDTYDLKFPSTDNGAIVGRETELANLAQAWRSPDIRVLALVAWAGVGKTALVNVWREAIKFSEEETLSPKRIYAWSFHNQGIAHAHTSSGAFFKHALRWFKSDTEKFGSEHDKGVYLAKLINTQRTLLILDGLEVFQPYSTAELQGQLNDPALLGLLQTLAKDNAGLCLLTTRQALGEHLTRYQGVRNRPLENLSSTAAVQLLQRAGVKGKTQELEAVATEYHGHAYSLTLLANYLRQYAKGDIRRRDTLPSLTDETHAEGWQAQQLLWAYTQKLQNTQELELLYLLALFNQPVEYGLIHELSRALHERKQGIASPLIFPPSSEYWKETAQRLCDMGLLLSDGEWTDAHPLIRSFFRQKFQSSYPSVWKIAHTELYEYYKTLPVREFPNTLEEMQPLFNAVAHGCAAGLHQQVLDEVYWSRIRRGEHHYLTAILGSFNDDLILIRCFFNILWNTPIIGLQKIWESGLLNWAGSDLRSVGRLRDALEPMQLVLEECINQEDWLGAAVNASNFSELLLALGYIEDAQINSHRSIEYADLCDENELFERIGARSTCAYVLHQAGKYKEALNLFKEAEKLQQQDQPEYLFLYSIRGFYFNTLLLDLSKVDDALERTEYDIQISKQNNWMSELALDKLIQSWGYIEQQDFFQADKSLEQAVLNLGTVN